MRTSTMTELFIEGELPRPSRQPNALVIDVLIDSSDQTDDLICPVTKLKVKIKNWVAILVTTKIFGCPSGFTLIT